MKPAALSLLIVSIILTLATWARAITDYYDWYLSSGYHPSYASLIFFLPGVAHVAYPFLYWKKHYGVDVSDLPWEYISLLIFLTGTWIGFVALKSTGKPNM